MSAEVGQNQTHRGQICRVSVKPGRLSYELIAAPHQVFRGSVVSAERPDLSSLGRKVDRDITQKLVVGGYSKKQEYQADEIAIEILKRLGYNPWGLHVMLSGMDKRMPHDGGGFGKTHPPASARVKAIEPMLKSDPSAWIDGVLTTSWKISRVSFGRLAARAIAAARAPPSSSSYIAIYRLRYTTPRETAKLAEPRISGKCSPKAPAVKASYVQNMRINAIAPDISPSSPPPARLHPGISGSSSFRSSTCRFRRCLDGPGWKRGANFGLSIGPLVSGFYLAMSGIFDLPYQIWLWWAVDALILYAIGGAAMGWATGKWAGD